VQRQHIVARVCGVGSPPVEKVLHQRVEDPQVCHHPLKYVSHETISVDDRSPTRKPAQQLWISTPLPPEVTHILAECLPLT